ncbi:Peroxisomal 3-ketoacyl-coA thiolase (Kat1) [Ceratobasidium theobromae]|uniref:Peroxisomal 3-ketoacyl-coA thiolase (Kat1) n=1 Tax=Ceratobasidium theobromae TaxID=1582974 RepID=A0A5N5QE96_9AGAM|nr:Peroxisomal 3-ketoacyl-coA thiolase (Kat1) [Ceratobasidium theobromae]
MLRTCSNTRFSSKHLYRSFSASVRTLEPKSLFTKHPDDVVLTLALRTPMCKAKKGGLKDTPSDVLLVGMLNAVRERSGVDPGLIEDIVVGTCHPPSPAYEARASAIAAGFPKHVPVQAINRLCSSGLMALRSVSDSISKGDIDIGLAVGILSSPRPTPKFNSEEIKANQAAVDCAEPMGWTSEMVAQDFNITREKMDELALLSHNRASEAQKSGRFTEEIVPFKTILKGEDGSTKEVVLDKDDGIRHGSTIEGMGKARSAFPDWGKARSTGANSSQVTDGAAAALLMRRSTAEKLGLADKIIAKHVATSVVGVEPKHMGIGPAYAIPKVLERTGLKISDIDLFEINEAFSSMYVYCVEKLGLDIEKVNVNGGAIALGHPLGATGVRQVATGLAELRRRNGKVLCTSMCIGSGMGAAAIFVNESAQKVAAKL